MAFWEQRMRKRNGRRGVQIIENALVLVPILAFTYLLIDVSYSIFVKVTLQHAVREGVRYAVTGQTQSGYGHLNSIKSVVMQNASGLLNDQLGTIHVDFYEADTLQVTTSNSGGNLVEVSVRNYQFNPLAPFFHSSDTVSYSVFAADKLESNIGGSPPPLNGGTLAPPGQQGEEGEEGDDDDDD
jgi:Flp pilus assembly protein TadG